ncbi:DNA repair protein RadC [uncultured Pediococcus sp.]|uniref:JAB domain-containing protein n=1 Tax=uncultured Pediococcus sp. TaxID=165192 RepID=UPI00259BE4EE|nr:DNA repair protein RadC [uncultured Pediococcus sp.]
MTNEMTVQEKIAYYGTSGLTDKDLIAQMLNLNKDDKLANKILKLLSENVTSVYDTLIKNGVAKEKSATISAAFELAKRFDKTRKLKQITVPSDAWREVRHFNNPDQEQFVVIGLDGAHQIKYTKVVTVGLINKTLVHPREVFADAIEKRCSAIIVAHNHPSGNLEPSSDDKLTIDRIIKAAKILGISVVDSLVFDENGYYSFLEHKLLVS